MSLYTHGERPMSRGSVDARAVDRITAELIDTQAKLATAHAEIERLRGIIAADTADRLRTAQRRAEHDEQMEHHLTRLRESQQLLANELSAGRR